MQYIMTETLVLNGVIRSKIIANITNQVRLLKLLRLLM